MSKKPITFTPFFPPQPNDPEYWKIQGDLLRALTNEHKVDSNMQIEGINIHSRSGQDTIDEYCRNHHITPEQLDDIPAFLRKKES